MYNKKVSCHLYEYKSIYQSDYGIEMMKQARKLCEIESVNGGNTKNNKQEEKMQFLIILSFGESE